MQDPYYEENLESKYRRYLHDLWKQNWLIIVAWVVGGLVLMGLSWLFSIPFDLAWTFMLMSGFALVIYLGFYLRRIHDVKHLLQSDTFEIEKYPEDLRACVIKMQELSRQIQEVKSHARHEQSELEDYFSMWAHEIKLPLAAMELQLALPEPDLDEIAKCEARISRFVAQAMMYVRLDGSDYRIQKVTLESIVRPLIREQSATFIARKLIPDCVFDQDEVYTDRKWIAYVIEQMLSNAMKYSPDHGTITIQTGHNCLIVLDEGCGIAPEDLPRIYEKGFTGRNGHTNVTSSSGLGLYLAHKICTRLGCTLTIENRDFNQYPKSTEDPDLTETENDEFVTDENPSDVSSSSDLPQTGVVARIDFPSALYYRS